jgi:hypothetical protein
LVVSGGWRVAIVTLWLLCDGAALIAPTCIVTDGYLAQTNKKGLNIHQPFSVSSLVDEKY